MPVKKDVQRLSSLLKGGSFVEAKAVAKYIRIAPRKIRIVMDLIRGKNIAEAFAILKFTPKVGAEVIEKVLKSAVANAEHNLDMNVDNL